MTRAAIWLRVSTDEQTTENQLRPLQEYAERRGLEVVQVLDVSGISAHRGAQQEFIKRARDAARRGAFDVLLCWSLDRLTREGPETMLRILRQFDEVGCKVWSLQEPWTEVSGELRELLLSIVGWFASFESRRLSERTKEGMARAMAGGAHVGRPKGVEPMRVEFEGGTMPHLSLEQIEAAISGGIEYVWMGNPLVRRLNARERDRYDQARLRGFIRTQNAPHGGAASAFFHWCTNLNRPYARVRERRTYGSVDIDMITCDFRLSDDAKEQIRRHLIEHTRPNGTVFAGIVSSSNKLPVENVVGVAEWVLAKIMDPRNQINSVYPLEKGQGENQSDS